MKYLIVRLGAFGDVIVITPLLRAIHSMGHEVVVLTSEAGEEVLRKNPHITALEVHPKHSIPSEKLHEYFKMKQIQHQADVLVDLCESVECRVIFHPTQPQYNWPKAQRRDAAEINMYELAFELAGVDPAGHDMVPELFFSKSEEEIHAVYRAGFLGKKVVVWGLSGSALHKAYPYTWLVMQEILERFEDVVFITVGDVACEIIEIEMEHPRIIRKSGKWSFRESMIMAEHAACVVSTETGMTHTAGCFKTPQVILYSHTTHETLGKHFRNAIPIHPEVACAPCFRMIESPSVQCPVDQVTNSPLCMAVGIAPVQVVDAISGILQPKGGLIHVA